MMRGWWLVLLVWGRSVAGQATFHGNLAHTGVYESPGPTQPPRVQWAFKTDGPVIGSPAVANGVVFFGSSDGKIYAVDEESGRQKWQYRTLAARPVTSSPTVANGLVYVGGFDGVLYAVTADSGALKWTFISEYERRFEAKRLHGHSPPLQTIPGLWGLYTSSP